MVSSKSGTLIYKGLSETTDRGCGSTPGGAPQGSEGRASPQEEEPTAGWAWSSRTFEQNKPEERHRRQKPPAGTQDAVRTWGFTPQGTDCRG